MPLPDTDQAAVARRVAEYVYDQYRSALLLSAIAGFGMLIWIFVELAILRQYSWLQAAYFIVGGLELILVLAVLGVIPALVAPLRESDKPPSSRSVG